MRMSLPAAALALALAVVPAAAQNASPAAPAASTAPAVNWTDTQWILYGRQITEWFFTGQTDSVLAHSSPDAREHWVAQTDCWRRATSSWHVSGRRRK